MARINFVPHKSSVEVREPDGDVGVFPAATAAAAGVMTAQHVQMLEETHRAMHSQGGGAPVIIERAADTSQFPTRAEVTQLLRAMPQTLSITPEMQALRSQVVALQDQVRGAASGLLAPPAAVGEVVDERARSVLDHLITQFEALDQRLRHLEDMEPRLARIEGIMNALKMVAEVKGAAA
jgi:hypothetical protein